MRTLLPFTCLLFCAPAWSCTCGSYSVEDNFAQSSAVFLATVTSNEDIGRPATFVKWRAQLAVAKVWKSDGQDLTVLTSDAEGASCGIYLVPGAEYIVFASRHPNGPLWTTSCSRTIATTFPDCSTYQRSCERHRARVEEVRAFLDQQEALKPNNAFERSVKGSSERAAGARKIIAPAARCPGCARTAQRGR
jgi:hypothetical protein